MLLARKDALGAGGAGGGKWAATQTWADPSPEQRCRAAQPAQAAGAAWGAHPRSASRDYG
jgi:hypothetical protein